MKTYIIALFLLMSLNLSAQKSFVVDFSSKIPAQKNLVNNAKAKLITAKQYRSDLNGTLIVTGIVSKEGVQLSTVILELANAKDFRRAQNMMLGDCVSTSKCDAICDKDSDTTRLICYAACSIFCLY